MSIESVSAASGAASSKAPIAAFNQSDGPSFSDVLDILNPLQHIPLINTLYQHLTGDTEGAVADVAGGTLWAGPIGLVASLVDLDVRSETGKSVSDTILGWLGLGPDEDSAVMVAEPSANTAAPATQAAQQAVVAAMAAPTPPPAQTAARSRSERSRDGKNGDSDSGGEDRGGARQVGDYLVFGAAGSATPVALAAAAPVAASNGNGNGSGSAPMSRQGNYMIFGAGQPAASTPAPMPTPSLAQAAAAPAPPPAGLSAMPARSFSAPERRSQITPSALPPPTTGPAALPGHGPSQAVAAVGTDDSWFVNAVTVGLSKYQAAQKLGDSEAAAAPADASLH